MCGNRNQPEAAPTKDEGIAVEKQLNEYRFYLPVRPGTRKAKTG